MPQTLQGESEKFEIQSENVADQMFWLNILVANRLDIRGERKRQDIRINENYQKSTVKSTLKFLFRHEKVEIMQAEMEYFKIKILKDELENVLNELSYLYPQRHRNKKTKYEIRQQKIESIRNQLKKECSHQLLRTAPFG